MHKYFFISLAVYRSFLEMQYFLFSNIMNDNRLFIRQQAINVCICWYVCVCVPNLTSSNRNANRLDFPLIAAINRFEPVKMRAVRYNRYKIWTTRAV